jgi:hypothetical protein
VRTLSPNAGAIRLKAKITALPWAEQHKFFYVDGQSKGSVKTMCLISVDSLVVFYLAGLMANLREEVLKVDRFFWSDQKKSRCCSDAMQSSG